MRWTHLITVNNVTITPRHRTEARVKFQWHDLRPSHTDIFWQVAISTHHPRAHRSLYRCVKVNHLIAGMHHRIGAPSATNAHGQTSIDLLQSVLKKSLNTGGASTL